MRRDKTHLIQVSEGNFVNESEIKSLMRNGLYIVTFCKNGTTYTMPIMDELTSDIWWENLCVKIGLGR